MKSTGLICLAVATAFLSANGATALSIYDVQHSTPPDYMSPYFGETVTVTGGIVTKVLVANRTKLTIQDPTLGDAWAGIQVVFDDPGQAEEIQRGDQVDFFDVYVDEFRGNTQLLIEENSSFVINSSGHLVEPLLVSTADIPYPLDADRSEKYEFMLLQVEGVCVGEMDLGSHDDNYELVNEEGVCWAADYANADLPPGAIYYVQPGDCFCRVSGYLEQYQRLDQGWDYYQLLPRDANDYVYAPSPAEAASWGEIKALFK